MQITAHQNFLKISKLLLEGKVYLMSFQCHWLVSASLCCIIRCQWTKHYHDQFLSFRLWQPHVSWVVLQIQQWQTFFTWTPSVQVFGLILFLMKSIALSHIRTRISSRNGRCKWKKCQINEDTAVYSMCQIIFTECYLAGKKESDQVRSPLNMSCKLRTFELMSRSTE